MDIPTLTASIVLYKTPLAQIRKCVSSLSKFKGTIFLYFVDNSPTDSLRSQCYSDFINTEYIHLPFNPGFGFGHNIAIRRAQVLGSSFHLVINADVSFDSDVISPMLEYLNNNPKVGQLMPKVLNPDGTMQHLCKLVPTPADLLFRRLSMRKLKPTSNYRFELRESGYNKIMFVPYLSGCFMLLRQSSLSEIGLFDERFFMYPEDIDLTRRMAERYETIFFPNVFVTHEHGAASHRSIRMFLIHLTNLVKYFNKWGWFFDSKRDLLNRRTLEQFKQ